MNGKRTLKRLSGGRCSHRFCGDCATRRGSKRGVRKARHDARRALRVGA